MFLFLWNHVDHDLFQSLSIQSLIFVCNSYFFNWPSVRCHKGNKLTSDFTDQPGVRKMSPSSGRDVRQGRSSSYTHIFSIREIKERWPQARNQYFHYVQKYLFGNEWTKYTIASVFLISIFEIHNEI